MQNIFIEHDETREKLMKFNMDEIYQNGESKTQIVNFTKIENQLSEEQRKMNTKIKLNLSQQELTKFFSKKFFFVEQFDKGFLKGKLIFFICLFLYS